MAAQGQGEWEDPRLRQIWSEGQFQTQIARQQAETALKQAQLQKEAAMAAIGPQNRAIDLQERQFDFRKGLLGNFLNQFSGIFAANQRNGGGGPAITRGPAIEVGPVFSPEEMAMQQNRVFDRSMQQAAGVTNRFNRQAAARGVSGASPFLPRIRAMTEAQGRVGGEGAALDFARQMATENARNSLASQQLRQEMENQYQQNLLSRYGIQQQGQNQLLGLLSGIFGGLT